jgi:hypothetical protein
MKSPNVPHDSFREGFAVGYQLIRGISVGVPATPAGPAPHGGTTSYLLGVKAGIRAAGAELNGADGEPVQ